MTDSLTPIQHTRHSFVAVAATLVMLSLVAGGITFLWQQTLPVLSAAERYWPLVNGLSLTYRVTHSDGRKLSESPWEVNRAGFIIHGAIHTSVPQAMCVIHTHTKAGLAVACSKEGLKNNNFYSAMLFDHVAYHDFEGSVRRMDERERLLASMGDKPILILRNHGLLVHGRTIPEAFERYLHLQYACDTQLAAASMNTETIEVSAQATANQTRDIGLFGPEPTAGRLTFPALMREMERRDPSFRS